MILLKMSPQLVHVLSISEFLRTNLSLSQSSPIVRPRHTFATHQPIHSLVTVQDNFTSTASHTYLWHVNSRAVAANTTHPNFTVVFNTTGTHFFGVTAVVRTTITDEYGTVFSVNRSGERKQYIELKGLLEKLCNF